MMKNIDLSSVADQLVMQLISKGMVVQRYDALSTNSIYIKMDYGLLNSIRISDHGGKPHLKYRYNIGPHIHEPHTDLDQYLRRYYPIGEYEQLIKDIVTARQDKLLTYGTNGYIRLMQSCLESHMQNPLGFWKSASLAILENGQIKYEREEF